ncbi:formylglycine-generating enzyme family protein [Patescibacteria group bacterium]
MKASKTRKQKEELLRSLNFVYLPGGKIMMGTDYPLACRLETKRKNETPKRELMVKPFWINKYCVSNVEYERYNKKHFRAPTSLNDNQPVTDLTYFDAIAYIHWLSEKHDLTFCLPSEKEWVFAAAPLAWEFPYQQAHLPNKLKAHTFEPNNFQTLAVDDSVFGENYCGLLHVGGNVIEMTSGWYYSPGHFDSMTDGAYFIAKGGGFGHCAYSAGVQRRLIVDVAGRCSRIGFRLAHPAI